MGGSERSSRSMGAGKVYFLLSAPGKARRRITDPKLCLAGGAPGLLGGPPALQGSSTL